MVALEALACGTPVLASDSIHSLPDVVEKCSMEDVSLWSEKISLIFKKNEQAASFESIAAHSVTTVQTNLLTIYDQLK
jgi:glycosyltransferase involved in cell wall biosynthesis